ncbi:MAG: hypothetical protein NZ480_03215 [Bdellovibrionaceae bacterium]|nr:hypothetical protein [Pseudobdellovibrionaceae bacterium]
MVQKKRFYQYKTTFNAILAIAVLWGHLEMGICSENDSHQPALGVFPLELEREMVNNEIDQSLATSKVNPYIRLSDAFSKKIYLNIDARMWEVKKEISLVGGRSRTVHLKDILGCELEEVLVRTQWQPKKVSCFLFGDSWKHNGMSVFGLKHSSRSKVLYDAMTGPNVSKESESVHDSGVRVTVSRTRTISDSAPNNPNQGLLQCIEYFPDNEERRKELQFVPYQCSVVLPKP